MYHFSPFLYSVNTSLVISPQSLAPPIIATSATPLTSIPPASHVPPLPSTDINAVSSTDSVSTVLSPRLSGGSYTSGTLTPDETNILQSPVTSSILPVTSSILPVTSSILPVTIPVSTSLAVISSLSLPVSSSVSPVTSTAITNSIGLRVQDEEEEIEEDISNTLDGGGVATDDIDDVSFRELLPSEAHLRERRRRRLNSTGSDISDTPISQVIILTIINAY